MRHHVLSLGVGEAGNAQTSGSPDLVYHGGPVQHGVTVEAIFWGTSWTDATFVGDKIAGLTSFYQGIGGSAYAATNTEYTDASDNVSSAIGLAGTHVDGSASARNGNRTSAILAEVCKVIANPVSNGYYPVYIDRPRGHAGFCAWHSSGTCNGVTVSFAFFFALDGDPGCDPQSTVAGQSQGLQALANVSGHELSENLTDPALDAWYDSSGAENADKCAWAFGSDSVSFKNRTQWKIQGNWSNNAFDSGTGYPNRSGQIGCLDGGNFK